MALYLLKELDNNAKVAVWQITETEEELRALSSTPSDEMEEISFIKSESLRKQRLAVRALLNELFGKGLDRGRRLICRRLFCSRSPYVVEDSHARSFRPAADRRVFPL